MFGRISSCGAALFAGVPLLLCAPAYAPSGQQPPAPAREFRGAWIATVGNIDWPSKPGLSTEQQKTELTAIFDRAAQLRLNALIFQVRTSCDALYASKLEPWSEYLTGKMGQAPEPFYDPLAFAVEEAHKRGMELHAWFNPFRARYHSAKSAVAPSHISKTKPRLVRTYGKHLWLDPGEREAQEHSLAVIVDVVKRYAVDGVHIDDYFYPYKEKEASGKLLDFPDDASWRRSGAPGKMDRADWRRENIDTFVQRLHTAIHAAKPQVKFGISPFGIWRPGYPEKIKGLDAYDALYADARKWFQNGWLDYCAPQLYWAIEPEAQSYPVLLKWWSDQNLKGRHLWPGNNSARVGSPWNPDEIANQIALTRKQAGASGNIHWNMSALMSEAKGLSATLATQVYTQPALIPASPWLDKAAPPRPAVTLQYDAAQDRFEMVWQALEAPSVARWLIQTRTGGRWESFVIADTSKTGNIRKSAGRFPELVSLTAVGRTGNLGPATVMEYRAE
jgi:uncharacterized lipoprotein YddW (UPF0748 family)